MKMSSDVTVELKGVARVRSPRLEAAVLAGQRMLLKVKGEDMASFIEEKIKRDGDTSHLTLFNPQDTKLLVTRIVDRLRQQDPLLSKGKATTLAENELADLISREAVHGDWEVEGIGTASEGDKTAYYLILSWPEGDRLRKEYGLTRGHDFHITLAFKGGDVHNVSKGKDTLMRTARFIRFLYSSIQESQ